MITTAVDQPLFQFGGGDLSVRAGQDINGGVYYVESGVGTLVAGNSITTNATRATATIPVSTGGTTFSPDTTTWLPTTLFLGTGSFDVSAGGDVLLGPVANPFMLPMGENNSYWDRTYFTTYASNDSVNVSSLAGSVTLKGDTGVNQIVPARWKLGSAMFSVSISNQQRLEHAAMAAPDRGECRIVCCGSRSDAFHAASQRIDG